MKKKVVLQVDDYLYRFYQQGADTLQRTPEDMMEQALFLYAGIVAQDLLKSGPHSEESMIRQ